MPMSGYRCPSTVLDRSISSSGSGYAGCSSGASTFVAQLPLDRLSVRRPEFYTEYLFTKGEFIMLGGKAPPGYYCAPVLDAYADHPDHQGEADLDALVKLLRTHRDWTVTITLPWNASIKACQQEGHTPDHQGPNVECCDNVVCELESQNASA
jgi:hypothetical protein